MSEEVTCNDIHDAIKEVTEDENPENVKVTLRVGDKEFTLYPNVVDSDIINLFLDSEQEGDYLELYT